MTQRLLLLYTGGTIGMDETDQGLAPRPGLLPRLLTRFAAGEQKFDVIEYPELIDSSAVTIAHWNRIIDDIALHYADYDGFIVVHGTDTMAYTASVLAFALQGLNKPVILTGSQLPLVHAQSDGWVNLADAFTAASQPDLTEVAIVFDRVLLRGSRARKVDAAHFHGFDSPNCPVLAEFGMHPQWNRHLWLANHGSFKVLRLNPSARVAAFFLTPGYGAALIGQTLGAAGLDAALLMSYGNGNTPADEALLEGVRGAVRSGTLVLNLTQALRGSVEPGAYAACLPLIQAGALSGGDMTPEAALAKLTWIASLPLPAEARQGLLATSLVGELTER